MTNQRAPRFIALLTDDDANESRRSRVMNAFWNASAAQTRFAEVIDLSASRPTPHASR